MKTSEVQSHAANLLAALLQHKYLPADHKLVLPYQEEEEIRQCVKRFADTFGVRIALRNKYIHLLSRPGSIFSNAISDLRGNIKPYENKTDAYLLGTIMMIFLAEVDSRFSSIVKWENEGLSFQQIEEIVTQTLTTWNKINEDSSGLFTSQWGLAIKQMYSKWSLLNHSGVRARRQGFASKTRMGMIQSAMKELEKEGLVYIRHYAQATLVTPTDVLFERLEILFEDHERFHTLRDFIKTTLGNEGMGA